MIQYDGHQTTQAEADARNAIEVLEGHHNPHIKAAVRELRKLFPHERATPRRTVNPQGKEP
jgi:hypothetical protein